MRNSRFKTELVPAALTGGAGVATLAAALLFRDQVPISKGAARVIGFTVLYLGMALFLWAVFHLKGAIRGLVIPRLHKLVVTGPFRLIRHPTYLSMMIALVGASIVTRSIIGLAVSALLFLPVEIHRARLEEQALAEKFGEKWREYASHTGFFVPRFAGKPHR